MSVTDSQMALYITLHGLHASCQIVNAQKESVFHGIIDLDDVSPNINWSDLFERIHAMSGMEVTHCTIQSLDDRYMLLHEDMDSLMAEHMISNNAGSDEQLVTQYLPGSYKIFYLKPNIDSPTKFQVFYQHKVADFINQCSLQSENEHVCYLYINADVFLAALCNQKQLKRIAYQTFSSGYDIVYFVLSLFKQESLSQLTSIIILEGLQEDSSIYRNLKLFFKHIEIKSSK
jgi:hypothetical protein